MAIHVSKRGEEGRNVEDWEPGDEDKIIYY